MTLHVRGDGLEIHKVVVGSFENNVFILRCTNTGEAVLIDAANEHDLLLELAKNLGVKRVLETHGHDDHIQAVPAMREAGYEVAVTALDAPRLKAVGYDSFLEPGTEIAVGDLRLQTFLTPGHTEGSMCFLVKGQPILFSGDTLFPGGVGNATFPGGNFSELIASVDKYLFPMAADTMVLPGHGSDTTIGNERPHLQEWVDRGW
jgi:glyoxylase-like metal-dependent hydrolase (beta-lactamase superfamily II)